MCESLKYCTLYSIFYSQVAARSEAARPKLTVHRCRLATPSCSTLGQRPMAIPGVSVKTNSTMKSGARPSSCMPLQSAVCIAPLGGALPKARLSRKAQHHSEIHDIMCHHYIMAALPSKRVLSLRFSLSSPFACVACPTFGGPVAAGYGPLPAVGGGVSRATIQKQSCAHLCETARTWERARKKVHKRPAACKDAYEGRTCLFRCQEDTAVDGDGWEGLVPSVHVRTHS